MNYRKQTITIRRIVSVFLLLVMGVQLMPPTVIAQSIPDISNLISFDSSKLISGNSSASAVLGATTKLDLSAENVLDSLSEDNRSLESARIQAQTLIHKLYKKNFGMREKVSFVIDNPAKRDSIKAKLIDPKGKEIGTKIETIMKNNSMIVSILPPQSFAPGKYTLEVEDNSGETITQDFTWGVLAINTNKSIYTPGEFSKMAIAVLDDEGKMVCDAGVELRITNQKAKIEDLLSTENGRIRVNPECEVKDFTLNPDYETEYEVVEEGIYEMDLTATTENGTYAIQDQFESKADIPFDIERRSATRIYPAYAYPVEIKITAQEDFNGTVVEMVPESFDVMPASASGVVKHDQVSVGSSSLTPTSSVLGTSTRLELPYIGNRKVTALFGETVIDEDMREKYEKHGVIGHDGIDFDLPIGTAVISVDDGEVVMAKENGDYGTTIVIRHSWGQSYYGHLSALGVSKGDVVKRGDEIGKSGNTGLSTDPHLHFGIKLTDNNSKNGYFGKIDPAPLLGVTNVTDVLGVSDRSQDAVKLLSWNLSIKKGDTVTLGYSYKAPFISPQFYTLGPARLYGNNSVVFGERRVWQIAVDDTASYSVTDGSSTATTTSGACDTSLTNSTVSDGAQGTVVFSTCVGRNDVPVVKWNKTLTWETMGIPAGSTITQVNGSFKYRVAQESHAATTVMGTMQLRNSGDTADCAAGDLEASFDPGAVNANYTTRNSTGNVNVSAGCQASGTSVTIRLNMSPVTGNNNAATTQLRADDIQLDITYSPPAPNLTQAHYRWRNDDGSESTATWRRAQDTQATADVDEGRRVRIMISNEGTSTATSTTYRLEYGLLATTCSAIVSWTQVPASATTEPMEMFASGNITDGDPTTDVDGSSGLTNENTTFVAGQIKDTGSQTAGISLTTTQFTELEFSVNPTSNATAGQTYCLRVTNAGSTTNFTYSVYAELAVGEPLLDQNHYRWRNDDGTESNLSGQTLYFNPTGDGYAQAFTVFAGCSSGVNEWTCIDDGSADTSSSAPTNNGGTSALVSVSGVQAVTLANDALPAGSTITQLDISAWVSDVGNPNTSLQLGYCLVCSGSDNTLGGAQAISNASYVEYTQQFTGLTLSTTDLNNLQLVVSGSGANARISALYVQVTYSTVGATWKQAEDTAHTGQAVSQNVRLRIELANTGNIAATRRPRIEYAEMTGGTCGDETYAAIPTSSGSEFQMTDSTYFTNEAATTTQLTATGTFTAGDMLDTANAPASGFSIPNGNYTEMEYNFLVNASAQDKTWCFKLTDNGTDLDAYTRYPVLSVSSSGPTLDQLTRHGKWFNNGVLQPFTF